MDTLLQKSSQLYRKPWPILIAVLAVTIFFAFGLPRLTMDNDIMSMLPKTERSRVITELYNQPSNFGSSNAALIGIEAKDLFSLDTLTYVKRIGDELAALNKTLPIRQMGRLLGLSPDEAARLLDGLRSVGINDLNYHDTLGKLIVSSQALAQKFGWDPAFADKVATAAARIPDDKLFAAFQTPLGQVQSLVNGDYITFEDDSLVSKKLVENEELTPETIKGLKDRVASWDTYEGRLVSKDLTLTAISVMINTEDQDVKALFNQELLRITKDPPAGLKVFVAGEPVIADHLSAAIMADMPILSPLMLIVLVLVLFSSFRTVQGVVYPLLATVLAAVWTLGLMGYLNVPLSTIGSTIPVLLMAIVSAYGIHQMNHYYEDHKVNKFEVLRHNAKSVGLAILLSGITVMIGFGSMITLEFLPIRDFGLFTAFGDLVGVLAALFLLPALLMLGKPNRNNARYVHADDKKDLVAHLLRFLRGFGKKHPGRVLAVGAAVTLVLLGGATMVKSNMDLVKFFGPQDSIRLSDQILNEKMAGTKNLSIILDTDLRDPVTRQGNPDQVVELTNPTVLKKVDQFAVDMKARFPNITKVSSYTDVLKKMNEVMNGGDPRFYAVPDDPALIGQYMVIFSGDTQALLTTNHDKLRIMVSMNKGTMEETHQIALAAAAYFDPAFLRANHLQVNVAGQEQMIYNSNQALLKGTLESIVASIVIVFLILLLLLRSFWMSLIAIVPIAVCLVVDFGYLGFTGTDLNTATALVSSIGIGIGIDFSIHFITWYRRELLVDRNVLEALDRTIIHKGRAIVYNLIAIVSGFVVLMASNIAPLHDFGLLTALCLAVTAAGALVLVPALVRVLAKKNYRFLYLGVKEANPASLDAE